MKGGMIYNDLVLSTCIHSGLGDGEGLGMKTEEQIEFPLTLEDTHKLPHVSTALRPHIPVVPRMPKKTRLERQPLNERTTAIMRIFRSEPIERLPEYFEQMCDRRSYKTAVICGSDQLTYQELDQRANRLAHFLISHGADEGKPVGILLDRSLDTYIALLAVLKAGAAFVPLDPSFPPDLVAFIAEDAGLRGIVTTCSFRKKTNSLSCPVHELDRANEAISVQPESRPLVRVDATSLCYIIYTFGSTGRPKGVAVSHANIVNFLREITPIYAVTRHDRVYQGMSIALDTSLEEIWSAWIAGATLVVGPNDAQPIGPALTEFLIEHKITVLYCVSTLLATIESDVPSLRSIIISGEACQIDLVRCWSRPGRRMLNTYGSPETTITATWSELFPGRPVTIGSPLPTYYVYILDDQLCLVEDGESGEICIGGPGVTIGYLNHPDLTQERFIPNPVLRDREMVPRLYRTGDIGRITPSGETELLGQIVKQAKMYGYRIESGEIGYEAFPHVKPASLNGYDSAPAVESRAISYASVETAKLKMLDLINIKNVYKHIMTDPLYKNSILNMASTFILGALGFVFWMIVARLYKAANVGIATTLLSIMTLLCSITILGLSSSLIRYLPKSVNKNALINSVFAIVTIVTFLSSIIFLLGLPIFSPQLLFLRSNIFYFISFIIFTIFCAWNTLIENIFMAFRAASNILIKNTIISTLKLALPFALITFGAYGIFASTAFALALGVLASLIILMLTFKIRFSFSVNVALVKETSAYSFANYIMGFMFNAPSLVLPVIILNVLSAEYAAYYYIASMIQNILLIIPFATTQALLTEGSYNEAELKRHVKKAIVTIAVILIPAIVFIVFCGNMLLQFFGKNYASQAFQFLELYSVSTIFTALLLIANAINNVKHRKKTLVISNVMASVLTLWLSYVFISGKLVGIGWGWTLGQAIAGVVSLFFIVKVFST